MSEGTGGGVRQDPHRSWERLCYPESAAVTGHCNQNECVVDFLRVELSYEAFSNFLILFSSFFFASFSSRRSYSI